MTRDERRAMWQARIAAFKASGESSVKIWCAENNISYQSMFRGSVAIPILVTGNG